MYKRLLIIGIGMSVFCSFTMLCVAQQTKTEDAAEPQGTDEGSEPVGTLFDVQVPAHNYYFAKGVLRVFGNRYGPQPNTPEEIEDETWNQLLYSYEAYRRGVEVDQKELDDEISKIIQSENVTFDWKADKEAYEKWLKERIGEAPQLFENQVRHLLQVKKLREKVTEEIEPKIEDEEAHTAFFNENSALSIELVQFDEKKDAEDFYHKVKKDPKAWDREREKRPKDFRQPGKGVTLQFIMDFWKIDRDALCKMVKMQKDEFHPPATIYKGWGVFKIVDQPRAADDKQYTKEVKNNYYEKVKAWKRYQGLGEWFKNLKKDANIKIYPKTEKEDAVKNGEKKEE